jgi:hypothetical protein
LTVDASVKRVAGNSPWRALERLQARLVLTQAGEAPQEHGWDAKV